MDEKRTKEIDAAWRKARRNELFEGIRKSKLLLLLTAAAVVAIVFLSVLLTVPPQRLETVRGQFTGQFVTASKYSSGRWKVSVQLESGEIISMDMPRNETYRPATPVNVTRYRRSLGPIGFTSYRFEGYAEK